MAQFARNGLKFKMTQGNEYMKQVFDRLDRMESDFKEEFKSLNKAIVSIARMDEKIVHLMEKDTMRESMINAMQVRLGELEQQQTENRAKISFMWAGLGAAITAIIGLGTALIKGNIQ